MADARSSLPPGLSPAVERVATYLVGLGHEPAPSLAMAANLLTESLTHPQKQFVRRFRSLTMTPHEREVFAGTLQARRVLLEGTLAALSGDDVREGSVLSAHALCEARGARRHVSLRLGSARAQGEQVASARSRLLTELDSIDQLVEAAVEPKGGDADADDLMVGVGGAKPHPRVVHLQNRLNMLGHRVAADGKFGPVTKEAVKDFQAKAGMDPSGVVDNDTRNALRHGRAVLEVGPAAVLTPEAAAALPQVGDGDPNKETGNSASQKAPGPTGQAGEVGAKPVPASKRVAALMKLLQGLEGLQESSYSSAREQQINTKRRELTAISATEEASMELALRDRGSGSIEEAWSPQARMAALSSRREHSGVLRHIPAGHVMWHDDLMEKGTTSEQIAKAVDAGAVTKVTGSKGMRWYHRASDEVAASKARRIHLGESAQTAALSVTHAPIGHGGPNWVTRSKPGNTGQLPAYIQNVRNAIMRGGKAESEATAIAIGRIRDWAEGKGGVSAEVKAAAAKAIAEWEAMRAGAHAKSGAKRLAEAESHSEHPMMGEAMKCPTCGARAKPGAKACPRGHSMAAARKLAEALERSLEFDADVLALLRECVELRETWADFDEMRHHASWAKHVKAGPMPGHSYKDSPGRGPTGKMRNFMSMSPAKLGATLEALSVHGEDHEAHMAAMLAAGKKLGLKVTGRSPEPPVMAQHPDQKVHSLLGECRVCGAVLHEGARACQRGHRLEEAELNAAQRAERSLAGKASAAKRKARGGWSENAAEKTVKKYGGFDAPTPRLEKRDDGLYHVAEGPRILPSGAMVHAEGGRAHVGVYDDNGIGGKRDVSVSGGYSGGEELGHLAPSPPVGDMTDEELALHRHVVRHIAGAATFGGGVGGKRHKAALGELERVDDEVERRGGQRTPRPSGSWNQDEVDKSMASFRSNLYGHGGVKATKKDGEFHIDDNGHRIPAVGANVAGAGPGRMGTVVMSKDGLKVEFREDRSAEKGHNYWPTVDEGPVHIPPLGEMTDGELARHEENLLGNVRSSNFYGASASQRRGEGDALKPVQDEIKRRQRGSNHPWEVRESALVESGCECGAPSRGRVCQRGHRLEEAIGSIDKGAFHRWLGKGDDEPITDADIAKGIAAGGHPAKMARFAKSARSWGH